MSDYKIKLEDKAAFINRLDKQGIEVDSYEIVDNKLKGYFEFTTSDPITDSIVKTILKQSPKINKLKEMAKLTKSQLAEIIREELASMKAKEAKKENLNEDLMSAIMHFIKDLNWDILGPALGIAIPGPLAGTLIFKKTKDAAKNQLAGKINPDTGKAYTDKEIEGKAAAAILGKMKQYGGDE